MNLLRLTVAAALCSAAALSAQTPSVLMISIDGMKPEYITHAAEHHLNLPTLTRFLREGAYADGVNGVFPTITYPSHTTLVTGVWPAQHGIVNNQRFDPGHNMDGAWFWYEDSIRVPTLWSAAHAASLSTASIGWPVTADAKDIDTLIPEYWRSSVGEATNPDDRFLLNALSRPLNELDRIADRTGTPYMEGNETTVAGDTIKTRYAVDILQHHKPAFMTVHLSSLDEEEHLHGPFSPEANDTLEHLDPLVAQLITAARAANPNTIILVVSDHGFADIDHLFNLGAAFVEAGLMQTPAPHKLGLPAPPAAWQAQPWALGCMFAIMLHDPNDEATKAKVHALLDKLAADPANGIEAVLDPAQVAALGGVPEASFVVTLRKGFIPGPSLNGPLVAALPGHFGTHGYNPATTPDMRSSFFAIGPHIAHGKDLGLIDMRSIAPTVAQLLGITLPDAKQPPLPLNSQEQRP